MVDLTLLRALQGSGVVLGSLIGALSYVAFRKHRSTLMLYIAVGFLLLTLALLIEGILFELLGTSLDVAHLVESTVTLVGLMLLAYHLMPGRGDG